jgi:hypothetical protein
MDRPDGPGRVTGYLVSRGTGDLVDGHACYKYVVLLSGSFKRNNSSVDSYDKAPASSSRTGKAVRATLILIPLLGLQYIVTPFRPEPGTPWEPVYQVTSAVVASCQGLCVALLFCFCNGEVCPQPNTVLR